MAAGNWTFFNSARSKILDGTLNSTKAFKVALFTVTPAATATLYSGLSNEVGTTNTGYTTGGNAITPVLAGSTSVTWKFTTAPIWTAGTANLAAVAAVLYETTGSNLLAYTNLDSGGATVTASSGNTLTLDSATNPVFTAA